MRLTILLFIASSPLISQWQWYNPIPTGENLNASLAHANGGVFAVGDNGTLLRSTNLGLSWYRLCENFPLYEFTSLANPDLENLWVVGFGPVDGLNPSFKILHSSDEGVSWVEQLDGIFLGVDSSEFRQYRLHDIAFINPLSGWAVGDSGIVVSTTNGGLEWALDPRLGGGTLTDVQFLSDSVGLISTNLIYQDSEAPPTALDSTWGGVYRTTNGGLDWSLIYTDSIAISRIHFRNENLGWALGMKDWDDSTQENASGYFILKTMNGGLSWNRTPAPLFEDIEFINDSAGWVVGAYGVIWRTTDSGHQWYASTSAGGPIDRLKSVIFVDESHGLTVGTSGAILISADGGLTWNRTDSSFTDRRVDDIRFLSENEGWYVDGDLWKTSDSGTTWIPAGYSGIRSIDCVGENHCWSCGSAGRILFSSDQGYSWIEQQSNDSTDLALIRFVDTLNGWAGSAGSNMLKTTDGGMSWAAHPVPGVGTLLRISFQTPDKLWMGSTSGLTRTTDGGVTWKSLGVSDTLVRFFLDSLIGWARINGTEHRTVNGGLHWEDLGSISGQVYFVDSAIGWSITGRRVDRTIDGGRTWTTELRVGEYHSPILTHHFIDQSHGWIGGASGGLLRYGYPLSTTVSGPLDSDRLSFSPSLRTWPNPFNHAINLSYQTPSLGEIRVVIYSILGATIRVLAHEETFGGSHNEIWDGLDSWGKPVPSGVYYCMIDFTPFSSSNAYREIAKLILMK